MDREHSTPQQAHDAAARALGRQDLLLDAYSSPLDAAIRQTHRSIAIVTVDHLENEHAYVRGQSKGRRRRQEVHQEWTLIAADAKK